MSARIPQRDALHLLLVAIAGSKTDGSLFEVRYRRPGRMGQLFHNAARPKAILDTVGPEEVDP